MSSSSSASWSRYSAIPVSTPPLTAREPQQPSSTSAAAAAAAFFARTRSRAATFALARRPLRELANLSSFSRPYSCGEARARARRNLFYFRANYALLTLIVVFLSLLWKPISMIVFLCLFLGWIFLYLARDDPVVLFGREIDDRVVISVLGVVTIVALSLTRAGVNVLVSLIVAAAVVGLHAVFRSTDDLYVDEKEAADWGLFSVVENRHGASSSSGT